MARMSDDQLRAICERKLEDSEGYETDNLSKLREDALAYYLNKPSAAPTMEGRSSIQSSDVADMVEHIKADILPAMEGDTIVQVPPMGEEDIDQARSETDALNYVVMQQNKGYIELSQAIQNALLLRNGFMKVFVDTKEEVKVREATVNDATLRELAGQSVRNLNKVDNGIKVESRGEAEFGTKVRITEKRTKRKVKVCNVDPIYMSWDQEADSVLLQDCNFIAERSYPTRGELLARGYRKSVVNKLKAGGEQVDSQRRARKSEGDRVRNYQGEEPSQDIIQHDEIYIRVDADGDGLSELLKVCIAGKVVLERQEVDWIPYCTGTPFIQPNRLNGLGVYDKLRFVQDAKTHFIRQAADNQNVANNARVIVVEGQVRLNEVTNSKPGGVVRARSPEAVQPFPFNDVTPSALNMLDYMDKVRSERAGAAIDLGSGEAQIAKDTAHGVERTMNQMEKLSAMMIRCISESMIGPMYELVHKTLRAFVDEPITLRQGGQFAQTSPAQWPERENFCVKAGLSLAERNRARSAMETVVLRQDALAAEGKTGIMVTDGQRHNAQVDWMRAAGLDASERYFTDPDTPGAQQAAQAAAQSAQEQAQFQQGLLMLQQQTEQNNHTIDEAKVLEDARQFDEEMRLKWFEAGVEADKAEIELEMQANAANESSGPDNQSTGGGGASGQSAG